MGREEEMEELSLELSIGGKYGKAENLKEKATEFCGENEKSDFVVARCDFSGFETTDPQRRREIQALRRQEARRKREEEGKKSRVLNVVDDKLFLEAQKFQTRVRDREIREKDCFFEGKSRKNGLICSGEVADELGLSLFSEKKECLYPKVQSVADCDSEYSNGVKSLEQCSSAVSHKGGSSSDTGSHSSPLRPHQHHGAGAGADQIESNDSSSQAETDRCLAPIIYPRSTEMSNAESSPDGTIVSKETNRDLNEKPNCSFNAASFPHMPCVSTTGTGPNGKIVTGFLYRYNKTEVSIMCVCHGSSFSPAEFVEHAGGVDVSHPLRHITVVPSVTSWS